MAIIIEEERNRLSRVTLIIWASILLLIVAAVYYVFFRSPQKIDVLAPAGLQSTEEISQINLTPESVLRHPKFEGRHQYVDPPTPGVLGRPNPWVPF